MGFVRHIHPELSLAKIALGLLITLILIVNIGSIRRGIRYNDNLRHARYGSAIPVYVAAEKGFWADEGLNVKVRMFSAGRLALDALLSGNAQVMSVSETPLHILSLQPPNMVSALVRGDIAGYLSWDPHICYGQQQLGDNPIVIGPDDLYHGRHCIAMNQDFLQKIQKWLLSFSKDWLRRKITFMNTLKMQKQSSQNIPEYEYCFNWFAVAGI